MTALKELRIDMQRIKPFVLKEATKELQERFGRPASSVKPNTLDPDFVWALAYCYGRLIDPALTWDEAGLIDLALVNAPVPPTNGSG